MRFSKLTSLLFLFLSIFVAQRTFASNWSTLECSDASGRLHGSGLHWVGGAEPDVGTEVGSEKWTYDLKIIGDTRYIVGEENKILTPLEVSFSPPTKIVLEETIRDPCEENQSIYAIKANLRKPDNSPVHPDVGEGTLSIYVICKSYFPGCIP